MLHIRQPLTFRRALTPDYQCVTSITGLYFTLAPGVIVFLKNFAVYTVKLALWQDMQKLPSKIQSFYYRAILVLSLSYKTVFKCRAEFQIFPVDGR